MKFKIFLICFMMLVASMIMSGCEINSTKNNHNINDLERVFENYNEIKAVDINYSSKIETGGTSITVKSKMIVKDKGNTQLIYTETGEGSEAIKMYFIDEYLYAESNGEYTISETPKVDLTDESPIPSNLDFDNLDYKFKSKEIDGDIVYTVIITDGDMKTYVEDILGETVGDMSIEMTLEVKVNKETEQLKSMKITITLNEGDETLNIDMLVTINATGEHVTLEVPAIITQRIEQYRLSILNPNPNPTPTPEPNPVLYEDTSDGVVKYHDLGAFRNIVFDDQTNQLVILRTNFLEIYDANTMELKRSITTGLLPSNIDVDNGKLVVGYYSNYFNIYDLSQESEPITVQTDIPVIEIVIDKDIVIYADNENAGTIVFHNINTNLKTLKQFVKQPLLTLNRRDHILYVTETGSSSTDLLYFNSQTGENLYTSLSFQFGYVRQRVRFDGKYLHHEGRTLNGFNGAFVSSTYLNQIYNQLAGFTPTETIYDSETIAYLVIINKYKVNIGIYDNINNSYIYHFPFRAEYIIELDDGKYLAVDIEKKYVAKVDVNLITEDIINDEPEVQLQDNIILSEDEKLKTLHTSIYTDALVDGNYIYTLNKSKCELNVYNVETLERVYTERFLLKPVSMDAYSGKLVISYGDAYQFRIYDTTTWQFEIVILDEPVYLTILYEDTIIYSNDRSLIQVYNMTTKTRSLFGFMGSYVSMSINREDGIIYFGERQISSGDLAYFKLETKEEIFSISYSFNDTEVRFDGNFVHYANETFDKTTGEKISTTDLARIYENNSLTNAKTIFDNDEISIFTGFENNQAMTIVYDLSTNSQIYTLTGGATHAYIVGDRIVIFNNRYEKIKTLKLIE